MLDVCDIHVYYGQSHVLQGVSLHVESGEAVALLGRNGVGKTTTLKSIMGVLTPRGGRVRFKEEDITGLPPYEVVGRGISLIPEDRRIFPTLTVYENLCMAAIAGNEKKGYADVVERACDLFPPLKDRLHHKGKALSGGEQQMLTIARGLGTNPQLLLIDEPTEGLMPRMVDLIAETIVSIRDSGVAIVLVEQNARVALAITERVYVLEKGQVKYEGASRALEQDEALKKSLLGV